jgi:beta-glucosidase
MKIVKLQARKLAAQLLLAGGLVALAGCTQLGRTSMDGSANAGSTDNTMAATQPVMQDAEWAQPWWEPRHREKLAAIKNRKVDLLMIGDSITQGWEDAGQAVWREYYAGRNAFNLGFSGDRTEHVLWRLQHGEVEGISPELAVLMIGTNNTGHRKDPPGEIAVGIAEILKELRQRLPETEILLLAIFPRGKTPDDELRRINDATNEIIAGFADGEQVHFLDVNDQFLKKTGVLPKTIMPDLLHPNESGYRIWAEAMEPAIARLMDE